MFDRHTNKTKYITEQIYTTEKYVIPFIEHIRPVKPNLKVLEIGCGEGGNLQPFLEKGCLVTGVDISQSRIEIAKEYFSTHPLNKNIKFIAVDIYKAEGLIDNDYDIIFLRDVIEHIPNQALFIEYMKRFMAKDGIVFFAFPPWQNPFGGHQQVCENKILSLLPFYHLFPKFLYKTILKIGGESNEKIEGLLEIKDTGISIDRFNRIIKKAGFTINKVTHFLINPNYEIKFGFKPKEQFKIISAIPFVRNFLITASYYIISQKK
jgi:SAM-dependent methyltransferase